MAAIRAHPSIAREAEAPLYQFANVLSPHPRPPLEFTDDGPGDLSDDGPRHDNDHHDYRKIEILPTADEILAVIRPTYMPKKDLCHAFFIENGPARLLDLLFRQLRCDNTESIRDICYSAAQLVFLRTVPADINQTRQETIAGNRYFLYHGVKIEELHSHEQKSMVVRVSYHCPPFMRGHKMRDSGRFQQGMLVALIQLDHITRVFSIYFLEVSHAQSTFSMDCFGGEGARAAVGLAFLPTNKYDEVLQLCRHASGLCEQRELYLIEFPKVLFAGFYNCLRRLQEMKENDFAFRQYIAPDMDVEDALFARERNFAAEAPPEFHCTPPTYAVSQDFKYDLSKLVPENCPIASASVEDLARTSTVEILKRETTLDAGQAAAFRDSLLRQFALTQGPPGCGKTFLGVQLSKALLQSRPTQKPILLVCLTNHALDNFLGDLRDAGVKKLLRIGSGSKEEWTQSINLQNCRRQARLRKDELQTMHTCATMKKESIAQLDSMCQALSTHIHTGDLSWHYIEGFLRNHHPEIYAQFSAHSRFPQAQHFTFEYWCGGGDLKNIRDLHVELASRLSKVTADHEKPPPDDVDNILLDISYDAEFQSVQAGDISVWNISLQERKRLMRAWEKEVDKEHFARKIAALYFEALESTREIKQINDQRDLRIMASHDIIAMTTTACAARWELLRALGIEILICEEAAEVMEAHTLCSLLPTLQHAIFIGDPLQLRPETNEQSLSLETSVGSDFRLDESLLERLMLPRDLSASAMPTSHLTIQRRMHPEIANITRLTYPDLEDHESTHRRSPTHGLEQRLFWWDHRIPELDSDDLKSHANLHEVDMVASLVGYLLRDSAYSQGEIAVLTPYAGQLSKLYERLKVQCDIWLCDKDRETLLTEELLALGIEGKTTKDEVSVTDMLRIATVDNFQGEEAKIVILSTVRSGGTAGFLKTMNRINVACSRARNGFYIIGNSQTLCQVPMWRAVIAQFKNKIGASLVTRCNTHPEHRHFVELPQDFENVPECSAICDETLDCGHKCQEKCHPPQLHSRLTCQEQCEKAFPCGHKCLKLCYQKCGECQISVSDVVLDCGHPGQALCSGGTSKCLAILARRTLACGHSVEILCGNNPNADISCPQPCGKPLACGHPCPAKCGQCNGKKKKHATCLRICNEPKQCSHHCKETCHFGKPCPRSCLEACSDRCEHGPCKNRCQDICDPCVKKAVPGCNHESPPDMLCCFPSLSLPCCEPCPKILGCGHACPSLHGEPCPPTSVCSQCTSTDMGLPMLYSPKCNHLVEIARLDDSNLNGLYEVSASGMIMSINSDVRLQDLHEPKCTCGTQLQSSNRYRTLAKLVEFSHTFDLLLAKMGRKLNGFATTITMKEQQLKQTFDLFIEEIRPNPLAANANTGHILRRHRETLELLKNIISFRDDVVDPFQRSIARLHEAFPNIIPSYALMFHLHFDVLEYRVISVRLADTLKLANRIFTLQDPSLSTQRQGLKMIQFVHKESVACVDYCQDALNNDLVNSNPSIEIEIRLLQLQFSLYAKLTKLQVDRFGIFVDSSFQDIDNTTIKARLKTIFELCQRSLGTCGSFMQTAKAFQEMHAKDFAVPEIQNNDARQIEKNWSQHELGHLTICKRSHVYSSKTFRDGCPDCGRQAPKVSNRPPIDPALHLFEKQFLEAMHSRGSWSPSSLQSPSTSTSETDATAKSTASNGSQPRDQDAALSKSSERMDTEDKYIGAKPVRESEHVRVEISAYFSNSVETAEVQSTREPTDSTASGNGDTVDEDSRKGKRSEPQEEISNEARFLIAMRKIGHKELKKDAGKEKTAEPPKELTNEEKFLVAMRKIGQK